MYVLQGILKCNGLKHKKMCGGGGGVFFAPLIQIEDLIISNPFILYILWVCTHQMISSLQGHIKLSTFTTL